MTYIFLYVYCFVIFCVTGGQINGDPAPGRSPGPPNLTINLNDRIDIAHNSENDKINNDDNRNDDTFLDDNIPIVYDENGDEGDDDDYVGVVNDENNNSNESTINNSMKTSSSSSSIALNKIRNKINYKSQINEDKFDVPTEIIFTKDSTISTTTTTATTATSTINIKPINSDTKKFNNQIKSSLLNIGRPYNRICNNNGVHDYLMSDNAEKIVKIRDGSGGGRRGEIDSTLPPIRVDVTHDVFDSSKGLIENIKYTVQLYITNTVSNYVEDFYIETLINDEPHGKFIDPYTTKTVSSSTVSKTFQLKSHNVPKRSSSSNVDTIAKANMEKQKTNYRQMSATYYDGLASAAAWTNHQMDEKENDNNKRESYSRETDGGGGGDDYYENKWLAKSSELAIDNNNNRMSMNGNSNWRKNNGDNEVYSDINDENENDNDNDDDNKKDNESNCNANIWSEKLTPYSQNRTMNWILSETHLNDKTVKFRLLYRKNTNAAVFEYIYTHQLLEDCNLYLTHPVGSLDYTNMPLYTYNNCTVFFPSRDHRISTEPTGLLVHLTRLNVPCINGGYITIGDRSELCGKLEDLSINERTYYFTNTYSNTSVRTLNFPMFSLTYKLVDYCYNITLIKQNSSNYLQPKSSLSCNFKIHMPYGNRIELKLVTNINKNKIINNASDTIGIINNNNFFNKMYSNFENSKSFVEPEFLNLNVPQQQHDNNDFYHHHTTNDDNNYNIKECYINGGIIIQIDDTKMNNWAYCIDVNSPIKNFNIISSGNTLVVRLTKGSSSFNNYHNLLIDDKDKLISTIDEPSILLEYVALPINRLVSQCAFGWVATQQFCVTAIEQLLPWHYAELECKKMGGHLASVRSEREQKLIDNLLLNSSGYKDSSAYWIGATDESFEGDYRWSNGFPFSYSNWFPGWSEHGNYNRQPNDDGLSGQDCVELRRFFQRPPGIKSATSEKYSSTSAALSPTYMWNDRDCKAKNFFLCERPMSDEPVAKSDWSTGCNKTIFLTKERPRASLWSPGFPRHYPDNINCFTVVIAPLGYNIVIEFEELVLENEPECSYDYLEIIDAKESDELTNHYSVRELYRKYLHRNNRSFGTKRNFLFNDINAAQQSSSSSSNTNQLNVTFFEKFLQFYKNSHRKTIVLHTPTKAATATNIDKFFAAKALPHRICGDWSAKLKLLRYISYGALLGLHFSSDYSHHFSGYKAKVTMKNASSECSDERLKPYNGACYLFVSYPEVDWQTAQQVCRGIGAQLSSISSADEQRFIITNIRDQLDYSPQIIYWLGGELSQGKDFEWTDGTKMSYQGWLPGQDTIENLPKEPICLGLQWKVPLTPMLPPGLYWVSQKCNKYGGYICKSKKQKIGENYIQNKTVTGTEGRVTSPGYPNTYPLNIDYWVKIISPIRTRLIIQFQIIDLEYQDECLYDYISIQDTKPESIELYEPGLNPIPMAMLESNEMTSNDMENNEQKRDAQMEIIVDFQEDYKKMEANLHLASLTKRDVKYFRTLQEFLSAEDNLKEKIRLLETFRKKMDHKMTLRQKRFTNSDNAQYSSSSLVNGVLVVDDETKSQNASPSFLPYVRWCGSHNANMSQFSFVSSANSVLLHFHSDYSYSGIGFSFTWNAIDISGCPKQILTASEGSFHSPNYPNFMLNNLDCSYIIQAPSGKRIWLEFTDFETISDGLIDVDLGFGTFVPYQNKRHLNDGIFVSSGDRAIVRIRTGRAPRGRGFHINYKTLKQIRQQHTLNLANFSHGLVFHLNYPHDLPVNIDFTERLVAPLGYVLLLEIYGVGLSENKCRSGGSLEIFDNYADKNGTVWHLCEIETSTDQEDNIDDISLLPSPIHITSYLNTLHIRQFAVSEIGVKLNASVRTQPDINYKFKLASGDDDVESCQPDPCQFGGKCVSNGEINRCRCQGHYTGRFCALNMCEVEPCLFGKCELTETSFKCRCHQGYIGRTCDQKQKPCAEKPCEGRGECFDRGGSFFCRCFAWWEGERCERRMLHIPYKPLSERMLQEPFWLGLITVFVVLAVIGLVWCAKRHFPEKIEKLLAEEAERNRPPGHGHGHHHHHQSLREQLQFTNSVPQSTATTPGAPRTIFGRLGIRKPSILSLSSPQPPGGATARTFSLDDLLRPPPRRTPSPRKKRNNSTPTKKNAAEKKQILQQLISPAPAQTRPKMSFDELIHLSENRLKPPPVDIEIDIKETTFSENSVSGSTSSKGFLASDKLEKKVTFARLLSKVSAEMTSGSEVEINDNNTKHMDSMLSLQSENHPRASSVPPSPCTNDIRSPHSTSSNQGSDSLSSFEMNQDGDLRSNKRLRPKVSSADSILAMFRNFASTNVLSQMQSPMIISPSSTPSASSPQDDMPGDDESSTSSMYTPVSYTSGPSDSPVFYRQSTIEVPVLDILNGQQSSSPNTSSYLNPPTILLEIPSSINKCLSPIREMPTPMPSPALTPIMCRPQRYTKFANTRNTNSTSFSDDDEKLSIEQFDNRSRMPIINIEQDSIEIDPGDDGTGLPNRNTRLQVMATPPIQISIDIDPPTPEERSSNRPTQLIIPQLVIEQPSPTRERLPIMYPGSPPPQRQSVGETNFFAPSKQQRRQLKQSEKPASLDLPFIPPMITITSNMSEAESSDVDILSPTVSGKQNTSRLMVPNAGMCYLSPFSICTRGDRTISESNLSSSGYSSMASPGPSRCGSSNPLCSNEMEDPGTGSSGSNLHFHPALAIRRHSSQLKSCQKEANSGGTESSANEHRQRIRSRSDSETLSDDILLESNDEGIGTDHIEEKIEEGEIRSAKDLELYISNSELAESTSKNVIPEIIEPVTVTMSQLQLPLIVIQSDGVTATGSDKGISPVSSRSESPLSERTSSMSRFSPLFYGKKDQQLPFTDSDGLYDFPSSDGKGYSSATHHHKKSSTKRRDRKSSRSGLSQSPTKSACQLEIPSKESAVKSHNSKHHSPISSARKSPKRRPVQRHPVPSSSSSSESIVSAREIVQRSPRSKGFFITQQGLNVIDKASDFDTEEDVSSQILPKIDADDEIVWPTKKLSRLKAIGNQIRFLRRLEKSLKKRSEQSSPNAHQSNVISHSDSFHDDGSGSDVHDSPGVTSPLLQRSPKSSTKVAAFKSARQKRVANLYSNNLPWRLRERNLTAHGDVNSD